MTSFTGQIKFPSQRHRHCLEINAGCHYILKHIYKFLNICLTSVTREKPNEKMAFAA